MYFEVFEMTLDLTAVMGLLTIGLTLLFLAGFAGFAIRGALRDIIRRENVECQCDADQRHRHATSRQDVQ